MPTGSTAPRSVRRQNMAEVTRAVESPTPGPGKPMDYDAFLSYAHLDQQVAAAIQRACTASGNE
jgi:hypothetical protein